MRMCIVLVLHLHLELTSNNLAAAMHRRYLREYVASRSAQLAGHGKSVCCNPYGYHLYRRKPEEVVRFSDYHPRTHPEAFFYCLLLSKDDVHFRDEERSKQPGIPGYGLLSDANTDGTYQTECVLRGFVKEAEDL